MKVEELVKNHYQLKKDCIFPAYNMGTQVNIVKLKKGNEVKVENIKYDEYDDMVLVMCLIEKAYTTFLVTLEQLNDNFEVVVK